MARKGRRRGAGCLAALVVVGLIAVAAMVWLPSLLQRHAYKLETQSCVASQGEYSDFKTAEQANNAAIIAAVGMSYGFGVDGVTVALATAIQESDLRNLDYGDRDSLGLFQQRPSQGWGEPEQVSDPHYASSKFYQALERVEGWQDMPVTVAAQEVQRSGFPDAYAYHEDEARVWATALTGGAAVIDCHIPEGVTGSAQAFAERVSLDFGAGHYTVNVLETDDATVTVEIIPTASGEAPLHAVREWAVATASTTGAIEASGYGYTWINGVGRSVQEPSDAAPTPIHVVIATG